MTADQLLEHLAARGVSLTQRGDRLHVEAPAGILSATLRQSLRDHKQELLSLLAQPKSRPSGGCPRCDNIKERAQEVITAVRPNLPRGLQALPDEKLLWLAAWSLLVSFERSLRRLPP